MNDPDYPPVPGDLVIVGDGDLQIVDAPAPAPATVRPLADVDALTAFAALVLAGEPAVCRCADRGCVVCRVRRIVARMWQ